MRSDVFAPYCVILLFGMGAQTDASNDLWLAAKNGDLKKCTTALKKNAAPDYVAEDGTTALWQAAFRGHSEIVVKLLKAGANAAQVVREPMGGPRETNGFSKLSPRQMLLGWLIPLKKTSDEVAPPAPASSPREENAEKSSDHKMQRNLSLERKDVYKVGRAKGETALGEQSLSSRVRKSDGKLALPRSSSAVGLQKLPKRESGVDPKHLALKLKAIQSSEIHYDLVMSPVPILAALHQGNLETVKALIAYGASEQLTIGNLSGNNAVHLACGMRRIDLFRAVANPTKVLNRVGYEADLMIALAAVNAKKYTPLHLALEDGNQHVFEMLEALHQSGANLSFPIADEHKQTPFEILEKARRKFNPNEEIAHAYESAMLYLALHGGVVPDSPECDGACRIIANVFSEKRKMLWNQIQWPLPPSNESPLKMAWVSLTKSADVTQNDSGVRYEKADASSNELNFDPEDLDAASQFLHEFPDGMMQ